MNQTHRNRLALFGQCLWQLLTRFSAAFSAPLCFSGARPSGLFTGLFIGLSMGWLSVAQAALPVQQWTASTGAKVLFVESRSIPMLDINVDVDAGSRYDPPQQAGLADMTAGLLRLGTYVAGQPNQLQLTEAQIADQLADIGAQFNDNTSLDRTSFTLRTLSSQSEQQAALAIMTALLARPAFTEAILQREKERSVRSLKEAEAKPDTQASQAFNQALYGNHPYGRHPSQDSISRLQVTDLRAFYQRYFSARRAVVTLIGDISRNQAEAIAEQLTRALPQDDPVREPLRAVPPLTQASSQLLPHPSSQAHIFVGQPGVARGSPDYFPLIVGNYILGGGGFVSRLTQEVREKRGLTYGVYSYFTPLAQPGPFVIGLQTKKDQASQALALVRETLQQFVATGPTAAELKAAKQNLVGGFALRIDNNRKLLDNLAAIGFYGLPLDYLDTWSSNVEQVSLEAIRAAFKRTLDPNNMATVVVGQP